MKERPILFTGEMVRAILEGRKAQTRRIVKPQPISVGWFEHQKGWCAKVREDGGTLENPGHIMINCPYGKFRDRLWVRESCNISVDKDAVMYLDAGGKLAPTAKPGSEHWCREWKTCPSIHMPRWASRISLEITNVRVERVQDISEEDAKTEGVPVGQRAMLDSLDYLCKECGKHPNQHVGQAQACSGTSGLYQPWSFKGGFKILWDSINDKRGFGWNKNPWVWVIEFKKI